MLKFTVKLVAAFAALLVFASSANAQTYIYSNSAGTRGIDVIDASSGAIVRTCVHGKGNGRGIVVVGTTAYYTIASSGTVWQLDIETCADLGVAFDTVTSGIATIAYDGTNFWINQYDSPTGNSAYQYSPTGTLLKTITLENCTGYCDGVEYYEGKLISNRGDAVLPIYDVYDLDGNLLTEGFIDDPQGGSTTGIAYDGTNFWVSDIFQNRLRLYDGTTGDFIEFLDITGGNTTIEDLSVDYAQRRDTGGDAPPSSVRATATSVPTLGAWGLIILVLSVVALAGVSLRRFGS